VNYAINGKKRNIFKDNVSKSRPIGEKTPRTLRRLHNKVQMKKRKRGLAV